jgi:hypothetical protein
MTHLGQDVLQARDRIARVRENPRPVWSLTTRRRRGRSARKKLDISIVRGISRVSEGLLPLLVLTIQISLIKKLESTIRERARANEKKRSLGKSALTCSGAVGNWLTGRESFRQSRPKKTNVRF